MTDYIPTTEEMRRFYALEMAWQEGPDEAYAQFDRWLEDHDRQVAAKAYEKGWDDGYKEGEGYEIAEY